MAPPLRPQTSKGNRKVGRREGFLLQSFQPSCCLSLVPLRRQNRQTTERSKDGKVFYFNPSRLPAFLLPLSRAPRRNPLRAIRARGALLPSLIRLRLRTGRAPAALARAREGAAPARSTAPRRPRRRPPRRASAAPPACAEARASSAGARGRRLGGSGSSDTGPADTRPAPPAPCARHTPPRG